MSNKKSAQIWLPYFKQGDDLAACLAKDENNKVHAKKTLDNHIALLEMAIKQLKDINDIIPLINDIELTGDTHYVGIHGDERIINLLINSKLADAEDSFDDAESDISQEESSEEADPKIE
jgi:hypothetical protein